VRLLLVTLRSSIFPLVQADPHGGLPVSADLLSLVNLEAFRRDYSSFLRDYSGFVGGGRGRFGLLLLREHPRHDAQLGGRCGWLDRQFSLFLRYFSRLHRTNFSQISQALFTKLVGSAFRYFRYFFSSLANEFDTRQGVIGNSVKTAIETLKGIAIDLQQNPYVRVKGFSVNVSIPPSLNIDFEMRDAASSSPPSTPQTRP
jgi:hypothetical protein